MAAAPSTSPQDDAAVPKPPMSPTAPGQPPQQVRTAAAPPVPTAPTAPPIPMAGATSAPGGGVQTTSQDLTKQTIAPGPQVDRVKLATGALDTFARSTDPYYQKSLRDATSQAATAGQLGSGQLRTSLGDAQNLRNLQLDTEKERLMNDAVTGSIGDQYANIGIAQQQQGFQAGQNQLAQQNSLANRGLDLQTELGRGGLSLAQQQAATQADQFGKQFGLAQTGQAQGFDLANRGLGLQTDLGMGQLSLANRGLDQSGNQFAQQFGLASKQNDQNFGLQQGQLALANRGLDTSAGQFDRQFGAGQQQTAFSQAAQQAQLEEMLKQGQFGRDYQTLGLGMLGNPSDTALGLAGSYGNQATAAGQGAGQLLSSAQQQAAQQQMLQTLLAQQGQGGGGGNGGGAGGGSDLEQILQLAGSGAPQQASGNGTLPTTPDYTPPTTIVQPKWPGSMPVLQSGGLS